MDETKRNKGEEAEDGGMDAFGDDEPPPLPAQVSYLIHTILLCFYSYTYDSVMFLFLCLVLSCLCERRVLKGSLHRYLFVMVFLVMFLFFCVW